MLVRQKHTQFPGRGRAETNVVGSKLWPTFAAKTMGLFFFVFGVCAALGGLFQINPVWLYGPFDASAVSAGSQPDWYIGWLEGALRLMPPWEIRVAGFEIPNPFFPGVLLPGITFTVMFLWPWIEERLSRDHRDHHLLDRPRDRPRRTALGVGVLTFYGVLFLAGGNDVIAARFGLSVNSVTYAFRTLLVALPVIAALVTLRLCRELAARDPDEEGSLAQLERTSDGAYVERATRTDVSAARPRPPSFLASRTYPAIESAKRPAPITTSHPPNANPLAMTVAPSPTANGQTDDSGKAATGPAPSAIVASDRSSDRSGAWRESSQIDVPARSPMTALAASITAPASS